MSHSLYLSHVPVIAALQAAAPCWWACAAIPASFAVAELLARFVGQPSLALSRRAAAGVERLGAQPAAAAA